MLIRLSGISLELSGVEHMSEDWSKHMWSGWLRAPYPLVWSSLDGEKSRWGEGRGGVHISGSCRGANSSDLATIACHVRCHKRWPVFGYVWQLTKMSWGSCSFQCRRKMKKKIMWFIQADSPGLVRTVWTCWWKSVSEYVMWLTGGRWMDKYILSMLIYVTQVDFYVYAFLLHITLLLSWALISSFHHNCTF